MSIQKEKLQTREQNVCVLQTSFSAIFLSNKITVLIFHIIHIWNKTLNPCISRSLEGMHKVQTRLQVFYFLALTSKREEGQGKRLHKVQTRWKIVNCFYAFFNIRSFCAIIQLIIVKNFFDVLKLFDFLNFYRRFLCNS